MWRGGPGIDSVVYAVHKAGFSCLRTDVQAADASPVRFGGNKDLVRGWYSTQASVYNRLVGGGFNILGQTGHSISGSQWNSLPFTGVADVDSINVSAWSAGSSGFSNIPISHQTVARFWHGLAHDQFTDPDWFNLNCSFGYRNGGMISGTVTPLEDHFSPMRHASILKLHVSDFGGIPDGPPTRPGWWALKSLYYQFDAINHAAGRTVCAFVWPEDIEP